MNPYFWNNSSRGANGYLKVNLQGQGYKKANDVFDRLEHALQLYLAEQENLADFEIKGKIGFLDGKEYIWKQYGKLPIHSPDWSFARLEEFKEKPFVDLRSLNSLCDRIEAAIPQAVLAKHKAYKESLGDQPIIEGNRFLVTPSIEKALLEKHGEAWRCMFLGDSQDKEGGWWLPLKYHRPGEAPLTEWEYRKENNDQHLGKFDRAANSCAGTLRPGSAGSTESHQGVAEAGETLDRNDKRDLRKPAGSSRRRGGPINLDLRDLIGEPDSFKRQKETLFRLARYLKRVPSLEEALDFIQDNKLFSGEWEQNQGKRQSRVRDILRYIDRTFDPGKCAKGAVNIGKYDEWAAKKFPRGFVGARRRYMTEFGEIVEGCQGVRVSSQFIAVFMAVTEFAIIIDRNKDKTFPHDRADELWQALHAKALVAIPFSARKWAVCRDEMDRSEIVRINRDYRPGKAMEWEAGPYFPGLGLWKMKRTPSLMEPGCFTVRTERREEGHNTLLHLQSSICCSMTHLMPARPPP